MGFRGGVGFLATRRSERGGFGHSLEVVVGGRKKERKEGTEGGLKLKRVSAQTDGR